MALILLWIAAGVIGFVTQLWLYRAFLVDEHVVAASRGLGFKERALLVRRRKQRSMTFLLLHISVVAIGVVSLFHPQGRIVQLIITLALLLIPYVLAVDGFRELGFQRKLLNMVDEAE